MGYAKRTLEEAKVLAQREFKSRLVDRYSSEQIHAVREHMLVAAGDPVAESGQQVGEAVSIRDYYQFEIYRPQDDCPYVEKIYARILVPRDRSIDRVWINFDVPVEPYEGSLFS